LGENELHKCLWHSVEWRPFDINELLFVLTEAETKIKVDALKVSFTLH